VTLLDFPLAPIPSSTSSGTASEPKTRTSKKVLQYEVIGTNDVAVPTHLFKVVLVEDHTHTHTHTHTPDGTLRAMAGFVIPNEHVPEELSLLHFKTDVSFIEKYGGFIAFPKLFLGEEQEKDKDKDKENRQPAQLTTGEDSNVPQEGNAPRLHIEEHSTKKHNHVKDLCELMQCELMAPLEHKKIIYPRNLSNSKSLEWLESEWRRISEEGLANEPTFVGAYQTQKAKLETEKRANPVLKQ